KTTFLVKGDQGVPYGRVVEVMALMQNAGIEDVGLLTDPPGKQ
ncbi:MAG: Biopolymer transport protein ExbD/TolR, partial [Pseudomonadota bacterium]